MRTISMDVPIINPLSTQLNLYQLKKKLDQIQDDPSFIYHLVQLLFKAKSLSTCKIIRLYSKTDFWLRQRSTLFTFLRTKETRTFYSRHFFSRTTNPPTHPHTHTHTHTQTDTHIDDVRGNESHDRADPGRSCKTREVERRNSSRPLHRT